MDRAALGRSAGVDRAALGRSARAQETHQCVPQQQGLGFWLPGHLVTLLSPHHSFVAPFLYVVVGIPDFLLVAI